MTRERVVHVERVWDTATSLHASGDDLAALCEFSDEVFAFFRRVDSVLSTFDAKSDISRWRRGEATIPELDPMLAEVLDLASVAHGLTGGNFDPWWRGGAADPTGLVKGWAVDRAVQMARRSEVIDLMINAGGDVRTLGERFEGGPWRVGIECPWQTQGLIDVVVGNELCVATSGTHRRGSHILRNGEPVTGVAAVTVAGPNLGMADAFSTAAFACGNGAAAFLKTLPAEWHHLIVERDQSVRVSKNWPGEAEYE